MKKNECLILCLCVFCLLISCEKTPVKKADFQLKTYKNEILLLMDDESSSPKMEFNLTLLDTDPNTKYKFLTDHLYSGLSADEYASSVFESWENLFLEYFQSNESFYPESASFQWEYSETMSYNLFDENSMVLKWDTYTYEGGAHGMPGRQYYVFDLLESRILHRKDFFREGTDEQLYDIVYRRLLNYNNEKSWIFLKDEMPLSQGIFFDNKPAMTDNFFINQDGFGLCWEPYEIAPYSEGFIEILLPWRQIRPLLKHEIMEFLEKCGIWMFM